MGRRDTYSLIATTSTPPISRAFRRTIRPIRPDYDENMRRQHRLGIWVEGKTRRLTESVQIDTNDKNKNAKRNSELMFVISLK